MGNSECTVDECVGCTSSPTTSSFPSAGPFLFPSSFPSSLPAAVLKSAKGHKTPKSSKKGKGGSGLKSDKAGNMIKTPTSSKSAYLVRRRFMFSFVVIHFTDVNVYFFFCKITRI